MSLRRNILANYLGTGFVSLAPVLAVPWYLSALGPEQYGLIGFISLLQAVLSLVDAGMGQALVREIAIRFGGSKEERNAAGQLLFCFERVYWLFAVVSAIAVMVLAGVISDGWLNLDGLPVDVGQQAVYGAAAIFAVQFPGAVYRSVLIATQAQVALNWISVIGTLVRHLGAVIMVLHWPAISVYLIWHVVCGLVETLVRGRFSWGVLGVARAGLAWDERVVRPVIRIIGAMTVATWLGALAVQMDKILLSKLVTIEQFGYYSIAAMVANGMLQLVYPIFQASLPHAIGLRGDPLGLRRFNLRLVALVAVLVAFVAMAYQLLGDWLLVLWLRQDAVAAAVGGNLAFLLLGVGVNAFYSIGHMNWLVHGRVWKIMGVNAVALIISILAIPYMVAWMGPKGAAVGWLSLNLIGLVLSAGWMFKKSGGPFAG